MQFFGPKNTEYYKKGFRVIEPHPPRPLFNIRTIGTVIALVFITNFISFRFAGMGNVDQERQYAANFRPEKIAEVREYIAEERQQPVDDDIHIERTPQDVNVKKLETDSQKRKELGMENKEKDSGSEEIRSPAPRAGSGENSRNLQKKPEIVPKPQPQYYTSPLERRDITTPLPRSNYVPGRDPLYLLDKARRYIRDIPRFEQEVRKVGQKLQVPPEWLMAVMYAESKFDASVLNHRGSGATGLIQFMVPTVRELNVRMGTRYYMSDLTRMSAAQQMALVHEYLKMVKERYGEYRYLTDLYLAILFPKAVGKDWNYVLYAKPSKRYRQNVGLDQNKDGKVTVKDIDQLMQKMYLPAYNTRKQLVSFR